MINLRLRPNAKAAEPSIARFQAFFHKMYHTPVSKQQKSSASSTSTEQLSASPQLPFDPPRRRSSLAFSKLVETPRREESSQELSIDSVAPEIRTPGFLSNIGKKRTVETPMGQSGPQPGHATQIQKVFQAARANLHFDMHFASSPTGSIESRLPQSLHEHKDESELQRYDGSKATWRYSTISTLFPDTTSDVREPLPDASPVLPAIATWASKDAMIPFEPISSGYTSPLATCSPGDDPRPDLPPLPPSGSSSIATSSDKRLSQSNIDMTDISDLTRPMTGLKVSHDLDLQDMHQCDPLTESPIINHLRRKPGNHLSFSGSSTRLPDTIFLSRSAKAAAESAKAKRAMLKPAGCNSSVRREPNYTDLNLDPAASVDHSKLCPDPALHRYIATAPCPNPFAHVSMDTLVTSNDHSEVFDTQPELVRNDHLVPRVSPMAGFTPKIIGHRATAAGSPMPFARRMASPVLMTDNNRPIQSRIASPSPFCPLPLAASHRPLTQSQRVRDPSEHFQPGWFYQNEASGNNQPTTNYYSFSTAAAKVTGESAAPDSRIRDSYRTDTLTLLAKPPGRYRKNGIAANLQPRRAEISQGRRNQARYPYRPSHLGQRRMAEPRDLPDMLFRSSPPRPSGPFTTANFNRKRSKDDSCISDIEITEDDSATQFSSSVRHQPSEETMNIDKDERATLRTSIFGPKTPEFLQDQREGFKELSPNVSIWRRGVPGGYHLRKKRRPSYWDGDLEEVRMSPAGVGGIASSPVISKRSMVAELENMSSNAGSLMVDERQYHDGDDGIVEGHVSSNRMKEVKMTDNSLSEA